MKQHIKHEHDETEPFNCDTFSLRFLVNKHVSSVRKKSLESSSPRPLIPEEKSDKCKKTSEEISANSEDKPDNDKKDSDNGEENSDSDEEDSDSDEDDKNREVVPDKDREDTDLSDYNDKNHEMVPE